MISCIAKNHTHSVYELKFKKTTIQIVVKSYDLMRPTPRPLTLARMFKGIPSLEKIGFPDAIETFRF